MDFILYPLVDTTIDALTSMSLFNDATLKAMIWTGILLLMVIITFVVPIMTILDDSHEKA